MASSSSNDESLPPQYQVFINFRGGELRNSFLGFLVQTMKTKKINVFIDESELKGRQLEYLFNRIEESRVAVAIFSEKYTESKWCLNELVKMKEQMEQGKLVVIPIFYKLEPTDCKNLKGAFGSNFKILAWDYQTEPELVKKWMRAIETVSGNHGWTLDLHSDESKFIDSIVENVKKVLSEILTKERQTSTFGGSQERFAEKMFTMEIEKVEMTHRYGGKQRLEKLEEMLKFDDEETRIVGVVGMPGIGKTTLAEVLYEKWKRKFKSSTFLRDVGITANDYGWHWMQKKLVQKLLKDIHPNIGSKEDPYELCKDHLLEREVFIVLDDVGKGQIKDLLGKYDWIKRGSKIVITSSNEYSLRQEEVVHDTYVIPRLNSRDSLQCFTSNAFGSDYAKGNFVRLSRHFVDYAKGNPLALKALGVELRGKDETYWEQRIVTLTKSSCKMIQDVLKRKYDELTERQKDAFLDVACFFKSENISNVRCLVNSCGYESTEAGDDLRDLKDNFLVNISGGRVEMHDVVCTFAKEQALIENTRVHRRLWNYPDINYVLKNKLGMETVRGVFLDMSGVSEKMSLDATIFCSIHNLLYLRIYSSTFLEEGRTDFQIDIPKELQLPLDKVRYLHWLKFPLEKLPSDFSAMKLVNLELPYSSIEQLWEGVKDTPNLKWVDLSFSCNLHNISGLSNAQNLERLNLEGCTSLVDLPRNMENMKSLIFLNMRCCKSLRLIPTVKLNSLKFLILSDCSGLQQFEVISENLEGLYLDGTALEALPSAVGDLKRLAMLNLKGCEMLESLPESLGNQKALEELILSGCSKLQSLPEDIKNMRYLQILLLDGTKIKEVPKIDSLKRLCLSRNNAMIRLQDSIGQFDQLKWLGLKNCVNLIYIPTLPPNLEFLDAHGCERLEAVAVPLSFHTMTEKIRSSFVFTNCNNLEQDARDEISSYAQWKCNRLALECYDRRLVSGALFNVCYPGCEVPSWFHHQALGSVLEPRLQPHWCNNRLSGMALCAVVSFHENQDTVGSFSIKCTINFENEDGSRVCFDCDVGGITEPQRIDSDHVFIGYGSCSHITKHLEDQYSGNSIPTKAFLEFYVIGACETEVVNCGISLMYAEPQNVPVEANNNRSFSEMDDDWCSFCIGTLVAIMFLMVIAPQYYLRYYNYCWPVVAILVFYLCFHERLTALMEAIYNWSSSRTGYAWDDVFLFILLAVLFLVFLAPQYYLRYYNYCWPVVVILISLFIHHLN